ncbi:hypothetical protein [Chitinimonas sp. BJB300]|uniref:hypothetical protein n=1 Tax=Chitinimonas sp. BJB300 TaxID=1559339 RepID=UPI001112BBB7|nr:hypothetical protein [Chitinimonas sp. BJB300]
MQGQNTGQNSPAGLSRDTTNANGKLERIFDAKKVEEQVEIGQLVGEIGFRAVGDIAQAKGWKDGSKEKIALHAMMGALQVGLGGGSFDS